MLRVWRQHARLHGQDSCWPHKGLVHKGRSLAVVRIGEVKTGSGKLIRLCPRQRTDRRLQGTTSAIREAFIEDAVPGSKRRGAVSGGVPGKADTRHKFVIVNRRD